jgi:flagellar protein FliL
MADKSIETGAAYETKSSNILPILTIAMAAVALFGSAATAFLFLNGSPTGKGTVAMPLQIGQTGAVSPVGPMIDIKSFIVNIQDNTETRYLKAAMTLEVDGDSTAEEVSLRMPQIKDAILLMVSNKTFEDLQDLQGKMQLRAELNTRINKFLKSGRVKQVYFTDFIVQ